MASVAICPHCYLQLAIPDHASRDSEVECPSCHTEFGLDKATVRAIPQGVLKKPSAPSDSVERATQDAPAMGAAEVGSAAQVDDLADETDVISLSALSSADSELPAETAEHADAEIAAWFRSNKTVPDVVPMVFVGEDPSDEPTEDSDLEDDAVTNAEDATPIDEPLSQAHTSDPEPTPVRPSAVTL